MRTLRSLLLSALLCCVAMLPAAAQRPTRLLPPAHPQRMEVLNIFKMYFLAGTDTVGSWIHDLSVRQEDWSRWRGDTLRVLLTDTELSRSRTGKVDTLAVLPQGRIVGINGKAIDAAMGPIDWFPRLPSEQVVLGAGVRWQDTIAVRLDSTGIYEAVRRYTVGRRLDTLGVRAWEVTGEGSLRFRMTSWSDSTTGEGRWWDVQGPVVDTFWIDPAAGRFLGHKWDMKLVGRSAPTLAEGGDTTDAGLLSRETVKLLTPARFTALTAGIPAGDTLLSVYKGNPILTHSYHRRGDTLRVGLRRFDGMFGTTELVLRNGAIWRATTDWVDSVETRHSVLTLDGGRIRLAGGATIPTPTELWGVADYGMHALLTPQLMTLEPNGKWNPLILYRPYGARWDTVEVNARRFQNGRMVRLRDREGAERLLFIDPLGRFLGDVQVGAEPTVTVPNDSSPLQALVMRFFEEVRGTSRP